MKKELKAIKDIDEAIAYYSKTVRENERLKVKRDLVMEIVERTASSGEFIDGETNSFTYQELVSILGLEND